MSGPIGGPDARPSLDAGTSIDELADSADASIDAPAGGGAAQAPPAAPGDAPVPAAAFEGPAALEQSVLLGRLAEQTGGHLVPAEVRRGQLQDALEMATGDDPAAFDATAALLDLRSADPAARAKGYADLGAALGGDANALECRIFDLGGKVAYAELQDIQERALPALKQMGGGKFPVGEVAEVFEMTKASALRQVLNERVENPGDRGWAKSYDRINQDTGIGLKAITTGRNDPRLGALDKLRQVEFAEQKALFAIRDALDAGKISADEAFGQLKVLDRGTISAEGKALDEFKARSDEHIARCNRIVSTCNAVTLAADTVGGTLAYMRGGDRGVATYNAVNGALRAWGTGGDGYDMLFAGLRGAASSLDGAKGAAANGALAVAEELVKVCRKSGAAPARGEVLRALAKGGIEGGIQLLASYALARGFKKIGVAEGSQRATAATRLTRALLANPTATRATIQKFMDIGTGALTDEAKRAVDGDTSGAKSQ